ncbi:MAG: 1-acyl-sn-glycerol-3-phosphate acyltransferase, partial [Clostridiales bacterium]|nr:1-acyl-sn-glycerol-3-phosphate acyltransferase [Clostridiales bacterium]
MVDKFSRRSTRFLFKLTGSTLDIKGLEKIPADGPVLYVCNHQSHMDSAVMHGFFPKRKGFISIVEVLKFPILRTWMKHMECVFMDRGNIRQSLTCINKAVDILKSGRSMVLFPEGRLGDGVAVGEFKKGSVKLAAKAGVPIIPVTIRNSINVMNKNATNVKAVHVECIVAAPINPEEFGIDDDKHVMDKIREIIIS